MPHLFPRTGLTIPVVLLLLSVVGCGGGGGAGTTAGESSSGTAAGAAPTQQRSEPGPDRPSKQRGKHASGSQPHAHQGDSAQTGTAAFETPGGDNSIQRSGSEASSAALGEAATALHGYLDARAARDWTRACGFMAPEVATSLRQYAAGGGGGGKAKCPGLLAALSAAVPPAALREAAIARPGAFRIEGEHGFLLFRGARGLAYFMPMVQAGAAWKVAALAPSALE